MQWFKGTTGRGVIGRFSTSDAAVDVMERPGDSPKMCRMSTDCCSDDILQKQKGEDAAYYLRGFAQLIKTAHVSINPLLLR